jgi:hypothetical protein
MHPQLTTVRRALGVGLLVTLVVAALSTCGGGNSQDSARIESGDKAAAHANPLVGTWRRVRRCEEQVRLMQEAGLDELIPKWVDPAEFSHASSAQGSSPSGNPCQGVNGRLPHDHVFYKDGRFASVDDKGQFVDDGHHKFVDDRTIEFGDPPGNLVHFSFSNDRNTVTFDVAVPDMNKCSQRCRFNTAYRLAVFYPGLPWKRVPQKEQWPGEV